jgi:DNA primase catalytic core
MISAITIDKIKKLDIVDVIGKYVSLTKKGAQHMCCCPFHSERIPSLSVSSSKGVWKCFVCDIGGDAISFVKRLENISYSDAVIQIADKYNIPVQFEDKAEDEKYKKQKKLKEDRLSALIMVERFFTECLRSDSIEAEAARNYAFNRWPKEFCEKKGIGFAPASSQIFLQYVKDKCLDVDILLNLGVLKKSEKDNSLYPFFRNRITIPICNRWGKIIGFTARDFHDGKPKYLNSLESDIYKKSHSVFGIDDAAKSKTPYFIIVEGGPDVLRLQMVGLDNAVASLGTSWSKEQFDLVKNYTRSLCFIPDADVPDEPDNENAIDAKRYGPGVAAVMRNGAEAIREGFDVYVRELPFNEDQEGNPRKNDADEYITDIEKFRSLEEVSFFIWLAQKRFSGNFSKTQEKQYIKEIASLLAHVEDKVTVEDTISELAKIIGRVKLWKTAVDEAKVERVRDINSKEANKPVSGDQIKAIMSKHGLFIRNNCYYSATDDEPKQISNFIMEPLYHIMNNGEARRIFRLRNEVNETAIVEFKKTDLTSLPAFQQRIEYWGYFVFFAKVDKLNLLKNVIYANMNKACQIEQMGWNNEHKMYCFGNGILKNNVFYTADEMGIVSIDEKFYIPAATKEAKQDPLVYQFAKTFVHRNDSSISLYNFAHRVIDVFGDNGKIAFCFLLSSLFRDIIFPVMNGFPILNLFGRKGSGKTSLAIILQSFFQRIEKPSSVNTATIPAMNDWVSQVTNAMVILDEYKSTTIFEKIEFLKGLWDGVGQTKKNINGDGKPMKTIVTASIILCGQDIPDRDEALYSRLIHLVFNRTSNSEDAKIKYTELLDIARLGNTHLTIEVLKHRDVMEQFYKNNYLLVRQEVANALKEDGEIEDRLMGNWCIPLATFRTLEAVLPMPMNYTDLFNLTLQGIRYMNEGCKNSSEMADFWEVLTSLHSQGRIIEAAHFKIKYLTQFRPVDSKETKQFGRPIPVLFLNAAAISVIYTGRVAGGVIGNNRNNWSTVLTYLKIQPSYLGLKQDRFNLLLPNGSLDYNYEMVNGVSVKRKKYNMPKAMCFDYEALKDQYGLDLETYVSTSFEEEDNENTFDAVTANMEDSDNSETKNIPALPF